MHNQKERELLNMYKPQKFFLTLTLTCLAGCAENMSQQIPNTIQDTARAAQYFDDELSFNTGIGGAEEAIGSKNITIVDVRAAKDYAAGHIPGAINIPYDKWNSFKGQETEIPGLRKDGFNYIYCYTLLCNLSQKAAKKFAMLGYPVKEMKGGFDDWKAHKFPIEK
ncbi:MAG: rhodanese-like domain-containing protein [Alphaproteobacteria bacterium]